jgi:hypothetical protein
MIEAYLGWYDDDGKKHVAQKVYEGAYAYRERFKVWPNVCLVSQADLDAAQTTGVEGVEMVAKSYMLKNNFWFGWEEQ